MALPSISPGTARAVRFRRSGRWPWRRADVRLSFCAGQGPDNRLSACHLRPETWNRQTASVSEELLVSVSGDRWGTLADVDAFCVKNGRPLGAGSSLLVAPRDDYRLDRGPTHRRLADRSPRAAGDALVLLAATKRPQAARAFAMLRAHGPTCGAMAADRDALEHAGCERRLRHRAGWYHQVSVQRLPFRLLTGISTPESRIWFGTTACPRAGHRQGTWRNPWWMVVMSAERIARRWGVVQDCGGRPSFAQESGRCRRRSMPSTWRCCWVHTSDAGGGRAAILLDMT